MKSFIVLTVITLGFIAQADESKDSVETLESRVLFSGNTLHKIEYDGPNGHEVHYFNMTHADPLYVCSKSCLQPNREKFANSTDQPLGNSKIKKIRSLKIFAELKQNCGRPQERPTIKICEIANAPQIQGYNELLKSL
jgi:hypothetical protein